VPDFTPTYALPMPSDADSMASALYDTPRAFASAVEATVATLTGTPAPGAWRLIGAVGQPAFSGTWVNYGSGLTPARFVKIAGIVYLQGAVKSGATGTAMFTLPAGFRPSGGRLLFPTTSGDPVGVGRIDVYDTGVVQHNFGPVGYVSLSGIHFRADQ
jgi:hypothetical protein